jgi:hypothetical protein
MTESNNFEDIKESFRYVGDALSEMRVQAAVNSDNTDKVLISINSKIDALKEDEDTELIKISLTEMKNGLEEKHRTIASKFADIESTYKHLLMKAESQLSSDDVKRVFDSITSNLGIFSKDFSAQKSLISEIGVQLEALKQDESGKREILRNISMVKTDVEKFSNGFESIILNLNEKFSELNQILIKIDSGDALADIKKDIENIFMSISAALSAIQVIDRKNKEFEENISKFITKEDFNQEQEKISTLIAQNVQIANYIDGLPTQNHITNLAEKVDTTVGIINALKNMISESGEQNQRMLTAQLESLERKVLNISTEDEFIGFRQELAEFSKEVIESTGAIRRELTSTNSELKILSEFLKSMNVKETFENFAGLTKETETEIKQNVYNATDVIIKEIGKNNSITKSDINEGVGEIDKKIERTKEELKDHSKLNMASVLEHIQGLVNDIFSVKTSIQIDNQENLATLDGKFVELKDEMVSTSNFVAQANHKSAEEVMETVVLLSENLTSLQEDLSKTSEDNVSNLQGLIEDLKIVQKDFDIKNQGNVERILALFVSISQELESNKKFLCDTSQMNFEVISSKIAELSETFYGRLSQNSQNIEEMGERFQNLIKELTEKNDPFKDELLQDLSGLKGLLESVKQEVSQTKNNLDDTIKDNINNNIQIIEKLIDEAGGKYNTALYSLQNRISEHLENVEHISKENSLKLDSSFKETFEIKSEIQGIIDKIAELQQDASFTELTTGLNKKFEGLLLNLTNLEEVFSTKNEASLRNVLSSIEQAFEDLFSELKDQKDLTKSISEQTSEELSEKAESIKNQVNLVGTDLLNIINAKNVEIIESLVPINLALNSLITIDFEQITLDIKNKINSLNYSIISALNETLKTENEAHANNISKSLGSLSEKSEQMLLNLSNNLQTFENKILETQKSANENLLFEIAKLTDATELLNSQDNALAEILDKITEAREDSTAFLTDEIHQAQSEARSIILNTLNQSQEDVKGTILNSIIQSKDETQKTLSDKLDGLRQTLSSISSNINTDVTASQDEIKAVLQSIELEIKTDFYNQVNELAQSIKNAGLDNKTEIIEKLSSLNLLKDITEAQTENKSIILDNINKSNEELQKTLSDKLNEKLNCIAEIVTTLAQDDEATNKISLKVDELKQSNKDTLIENFDELKQSNESALSKKVNELIGELKEAGIQNKFEILSKFAESEATSKEALLDEINATQKQITAAIINKIDAAKEETETILLEELEENINLIKQLVSTFANNKDLTEVLETKTEKMYSLIQAASDKLEGQASILKDEFKNSTNIFVSEFKSDFYEKFEDFVDDIQAKLSHTVEKLGPLNQILENQDGVKFEVFGKITEAEDNIKSNIIERLNQSQEENKSAIIHEIVKAREEAEETILEELSQNINVIKEVITTVSGSKDWTETVSTKIENFHSTIQSMSSQVEGVLSNSAEEYKTSTHSALNEMKLSFYEKVDDSLDELKSIIEISQDKKDFLDDIDRLKTDFFEKIENFSESVDYSFKSMTIREDLDSFGENIKFSTNAIIEELQQKLTGLLETNQASISGKTDEVNNKLEELKKGISEEISEKLAFLELIFDNQKKDFSEGFENIKALFGELKENYVDLSINSNMEMSNVLVAVQEKIDKIETKIEELNISTSLADLSEKLEELNFDEKFDNLETKINSLGLDGLIESTKQDLSDNFEVVNQKLDLLTNSSSSNIEEGVNEIRETLQSQIEGFEKLSKLDSLDEIKEALVPLQNMPTIEGLENVKADIQGAIALFEKKVADLFGKMEELPIDSLSAIEPKAKAPKDISELFEEAERIEESDGFGNGLPNELLSSKKSEDLDEFEWQDEQEIETFDDKPKKIKSVSGSSDIKQELDAFKAELFESILDVFNQISFVTEADDIKDFLDERMEEVKTEIIDSLGGIPLGEGFEPRPTSAKKEARQASVDKNFENVLSSLDILHEKATAVDGSCDEIINEIKEVKEKLMSSDTDNYSYTLQDVETDISKLRIILNEISSSKPELNPEQFDLEKLHENIVSISTRTNKLLLNSDESYTVLKDYLNTFRDIIFQIDNKITYLDNNGGLNKIDKKLEKN